MEDVSCWEIIGEMDSKRKALCRCICGKEKMVNIDNINSLKSISCGCEGKTFVPKDVRRTFNLMKYRCNTKTSSDYNRWGGRGIKVLYKDVQQFHKDVGDKPSKHHSIDRIDGNESYKIGNCRWATHTQQNNNNNMNIILEYNNKKQTLAQWSRDIGIKYSTIRERLKRGWIVEKALTTKVRKLPC